MTEGSIASAAAIPETEYRDPSSPDSGRKRRQSLHGHDGRDDDIKRRRMSTEINNHISAAQPAPASSTSRDTAPVSRRTSASGDREEERKRGQRLFGAVLGTLSQNSTSATQRRRADIEKKQQDKLKSQDVEYNEGQRRRQEELIAARRKEQSVYDRQSMERRHSNMLSMAHFLKTDAEPVLYYKPWQLRPGEESRIQSQVEDAKSTIAREVEEFDQSRPPSSPRAQDDRATAATDEPPDGDRDTQTHTTTEEAKDTTVETEAAVEAETVGADANKIDQEEQLSHDHPSPADTGTNPDPSSSNPNAANPDSKAPEDDAEEVVEDNEDTVIY